MPVFIPRQPTTSLLRDHTGRLLEIQHIDPEFWGDDGPIEHGRYSQNQHSHLRNLMKRNDILYHYTSLTGLHGIVSDGALRASDVRAMNDRSEIRHALDILRAAVEPRLKRKLSSSAIEGLFGTARFWLLASSFSKSRDQLSQWRAYGSRIGVSIGFDRKYLEQIAQPQGAIIRDCKYAANSLAADDENVLAILEALEKDRVLDDMGNFVESHAALSFQREVLRLAAFIKHSTFEEEQEVRALVALDQVASGRLNYVSRDAALTPFVTLDLDCRRGAQFKRPKFGNCLGMMEILVWPRDADEQILDAISMLLAPAGGVMIRRSDSPYRV